MDKTLIGALALCVTLLLSVLYLYPQYKDQSRSPLAEWHLINTNKAGYQGEANLLMVGNTTVMIDAGFTYPGYLEVAPYLEKYNISKIDHLFLTHPDEAYYGGLIAMLEDGVTVKKIYHHRASIDAVADQQIRMRMIHTLHFALEKGAELIEIDKDFELRLPHLGRIRVVHEWAIGDLENLGTIGDTSLVLRLDILGYSVLFAGNIDQRVADQIDDKYLKNVDFVKMPQPSVGKSAPLSLLAKTTPSWLLVPSAKRYWCGEIGDAERKWSIRKELPTWVTGLNGSIRVIWRPEQTMIVPQYEDARCKFKEFGSVKIAR